jgi:hypothetical protein
LRKADSVDVSSYSNSSWQQLEGLCTQIIYTYKALHLHYTSNTLSIPQPAYLQQHPKAERITDQPMTGTGSPTFIITAPVYGSVRLI